MTLVYGSGEILSCQTFPKGIFYLSKKVKRIFSKLQSGSKEKWDWRTYTSKWKVNPLLKVLKIAACPLPYLMPLSCKVSIQIYILKAYLVHQLAILLPQPQYI